MLSLFCKVNVLVLQLSINNVEIQNNAAFFNILEVIVVFQTTCYGVSLYKDLFNKITSVHSTEFKLTVLPCVLLV